MALGNEKGHGLEILRTTRGLKSTCVNHEDLVWIWLPPCDCHWAGLVETFVFGPSDTEGDDGGVVLAHVEK